MLVIVVVIALVSALCWHSLLKRPLIASVGSTLTSVMVIWLLASSYIGYLDWQFIKNMVGVLLISLAVSLIVGLLFKKMGSKETI